MTESVRPMSNMMQPAGPPAVAGAGALAGVVIAAPDLDPPPVGRAALHRFLETWRILR